MEVEVVLPARNWGSLEDALWSLTEVIAKHDPDVVGHGVLGGGFGYGANYENDVFEMRSYYWGDCDCGADERNEKFWSEHAHAPDCYQTELRKREKEAGVERYSIQDKIYKAMCREYGQSEYGCAVHCTCGLDKIAEAYFEENGHRPTCACVLPNYRHKASGFEVRWYKYIGRGMELKGDGNWLDAVNESIVSLEPSSG